MTAKEECIQTIARLLEQHRAGPPRRDDLAWEVTLLDDDDDAVLTGSVSTEGFGQIESVLSSVTSRGLGLSRRFRSIPIASAA